MKNNFETFRSILAPKYIKKNLNFIDFFGILLPQKVYETAMRIKITRSSNLAFLAFLAFFCKTLPISLELSSSVIDQFKCFFSTRDRSVWSQSQLDLRSRIFARDSLKENASWKGWIGFISWLPQRCQERLFLLCHSVQRRTCQTVP